MKSQSEWAAVGINIAAAEAWYSKLCGKFGCAILILLHQLFTNFLLTGPSELLIVMNTTTGIQHWAEILKRKLFDGERWAIELSDEEATKLIYNLESFAKDAVRTAQAHEQLKFHCAYGAKICTDLEAGPEKCAQLEPLVNVLAERLTQEEAVVLNGKGSFNHTPAECLGRAVRSLR